MPADKITFQSVDDTLYGLNVTDRGLGQIRLNMASGFAFRESLLRYIANELHRSYCECDLSLSAFKTELLREAEEGNQKVIDIAMEEIGRLRDNEAHVRKLADRFGVPRE